MIVRKTSLPVLFLTAFLASCSQPDTDQTESESETQTGQTDQTAKSERPTREEIEAMGRVRGDQAMESDAMVMTGAPLPEGPSTTTNSPASTFKSTSARATIGTPSPNLFETLRSSIISWPFCQLGG